MKAFLAAVAALIVISVGASFGLGEAGFSAEEVYQSESVRLGD